MERKSVSPFSVSVTSPSPHRRGGDGSPYGHHTIAAPGQHRGQPPAHHHAPSVALDELMHENRMLKQELKEKDIVNSSLQHRVNYLENQIHELRQLPTGKISHIPIE